MKNQRNSYFSLNQGLMVKQIFSPSILPLQPYNTYSVAPYVNILWFAQIFGDGNFFFHFWQIWTFLHLKMFASIFFDHCMAVILVFQNGRHFAYFMPINPIMGYFLRWICHLSIPKLLKNVIPCTKSMPIVLFQLF